MMAKTKTKDPQTEPEEARAESAGQPEPAAEAPSQMPEAQADEQAAHGPEFAPLDAQARPDSHTSLGLIMDLDLRLTAELGRAELMIRDLLQLGPGSIIELDTTVGEPVAVLVNNRLIARGEVVVIDDSFGVRITEIVSPMERAQSAAPREEDQE
jgi:flagellar motor switch protein FliN/FliY